MTHLTNESPLPERKQAKDKINSLPNTIDALSFMKSATTDQRILITDSLIEKHLMDAMKKHESLSLIAAYGCQDQLRIVVRPKSVFNLGEVTIILSLDSISWTCDKRQVVFKYRLASSSRPLMLRMVEVVARGSLGLLFGPIFGALGGLVACQISERIIQGMAEPSSVLSDKEFITHHKRMVCINLDKHDIISRIANYRIESLRQAPRVIKNSPIGRTSLLDALVLDSIDLSPEGISINLALSKGISRVFSVVNNAITCRSSNSEQPPHVSS